MAISSARMLMAISAGVMAPMSRPIGRVHAAEALERHAFGLERVEDARDLRAAADQAEVAQVARGQRAERVEVVGVAARDDDDVGGRRQLGAMQPRADVVDFDRLGSREALGVGELLAVVDDVDAEAGVGGDARRDASRRGRRRSM